jgi:hypothetical protein
METKNTKKQYSKPQLFEVGDAIETTLGRGTWFRDPLFPRRRLVRLPFGV